MEVAKRVNPASLRSIVLRSQTLPLRHHLRVQYLRCAECRLKGSRTYKDRAIQGVKSNLPRREATPTLLGVLFQAVEVQS